MKSNEIPAKTRCRKSIIIRLGGGLEKRTSYAAIDYHTRLGILLRSHLAAADNLPTNFHREAFRIGQFA